MLVSKSFSQPQCLRTVGSYMLGRFYNRNLLNANLLIHTSSYGLIESRAFIPSDGTEQNMQLFWTDDSVRGLFMTVLCDLQASPGLSRPLLGGPVYVDDRVERFGGIIELQLF